MNQTYLAAGLLTQADRRAPRALDGGPALAVLDVDCRPGAGLGPAVAEMSAATASLRP